MGKYVYQVVYDEHTDKYKLLPVKKGAPKQGIHLGNLCTSFPVSKETMDHSELVTFLQGQIDNIKSQTAECVKGSMRCSIFSRSEKIVPISKTDVKEYFSAQSILEILLEDPIQ